MRALVISPRIPPQPGVGDFGVDRRTRLFIEGLAQVCDQVDFLYFVPASFIASRAPDDYGTQAVWRVTGASRFAPTAKRRESFVQHYLAGMLDARRIQAFHAYAGPEQLLAIRAATEPAPDVIYANQLHGMLPLVSSSAKLAAPVLFDLDDLVHKVHWRTATTGPLRPGKVAYAMQVPAILAAERKAIRAASLTTVCAEADRRMAARLAGTESVRVVPNAVDRPATVTPVPSAPTLLFLGNYSYAPNREAAERLVNRIWPRVLGVRPDARLWIAGGGTEHLSFAGSVLTGVECLGFVPDLGSLYAQTRVVCCPLSIGGGTRLKLIEAAAHGRPIVSTRVGAEGLELQDGTNALLRDSDEAFASACVQLLANTPLCERIGEAARRTSERYEATTVRAQIAGLVRDLVAGTVGAQLPVA